MTLGEPKPSIQPIILDCTIRDGSYAIDFKFTAEDSALLAGLLDAAGVPYIEIGHGLGLGASKAGKGRAASSDLEVVQKARGRVNQGRIGAFFIPGIGTERDLFDAADAGLDFVRIGQDADRMEQVLPYIELGVRLGLEVFVNFMKTYGISPNEFAGIAKGASEYGATGVYVVDSAGGMLPSEVANYVTATREVCDVAIGFHGHSNLHLAVANSIAANDAGATFIDSSVYGIGRSSGNVPTEVIVAVFDRIGIDCGIDLFEIIDIADAYVRPLVERSNPHTMTAVALGYGRFHSGYLSKVLEVAQQTEVDPFRLIVDLGRRDVMRLSDNDVEEAVATLRDCDSGSPAQQEEISEVARFSDSRFGPRRIANRKGAVSELLDGLEVAAAKRRLSIVTDLILTPALDEESVTAEFVLEDEHQVMGRFRFGSTDAIIEALKPHCHRIDVALLACEKGTSGKSSRLIQKTLAGTLPTKLVNYRRADLELDFLSDVATSKMLACDADRIVFCNPGAYMTSDVDIFIRRMNEIAPVSTSDLTITRSEDALVVVAGPLGCVSGQGLEMSKGCIFLGQLSDVDPRLRTSPLTILERDDAYRGMFPRWQRTLKSINSTLTHSYATA